MRLHTLLTLPSFALETSAKALRLLAYANELLAAKVASAAQASADARSGGAAQATTNGQRRDVSTPAPAAPAAEAEVSASSPSATAEELPRDIATLAGLPAPTVVRAIDTLSSPELADLYDHESNHRRRRTVLHAIEAALAPPATATDDDLLDDVRVPDEVVYSTQTPRR